MVSAASCLCGCGEFVAANRRYCKSHNLRRHAERSSSGFSGHRHSDDFKRLIGAKNRGRIWSAASRAKTSLAQMGRPRQWKHSPEALARLSESAKRQWSDPDMREKMLSGLREQSLEQRARRRIGKQRHVAARYGSCGCAVCKFSNPSRLSHRAYELFLQDFDVVIAEERFGPYRVDFLLAEEWLAIEVDGDYWHAQRKEHDAMRDAFLLSEFGLPVARLTEQDILRVA